ncbi:MAG: hypothetical protein IH587_08115 [Anaerolineae bacterium]|nr:hypothetical protein [Anaerolineae bacterium]
MAFIDIQVEADQAINGLAALSQMRGLRRGLAGAAVHLQGKAAAYPPERHAPQPMTDAQRRGFFAKLRAGEIEVPYVRGSSSSSENLGQRWTVEERDGGLTQVVGNNASYARLVQSAERQTFYHKVTGWKTDEQIMNEESRRVQEIVNAEIAADVEASAR